MMRNYIIIVFYFVLFACNPSEDPQDEYITLSENDLSISYNDEFQILAVFNRAGYTTADLIWESEAENIANVDQNGLVTGKRKGKTTITVRTADNLFSSSCKVEVQPINFLFKEPYFDFGKDQAFITNKESRYLSVQIPEAMIFDGENQNIRYLNYRFKEGKYEYSFVVLPGDQDIQEEVHDFLIQRYDLLGSSTLRLYFENEEVNITYAIDEYRDIVIFYFPKVN
ncbi:Ig-like domain-containing protein [Cyclobacterium amurskyense]|uniref:Ig-like domain-containing protein n=1 Tax=Cyclobacterium amurskyense TaxID=320787 RepID=UPI0030DC527A|tara:strand:+ start:3143 stop:3820 length:678 start_codon:yes stop_codon:yes gene_type:complete